MPPRCRRGSGFSLIIVFLLIILMLGVGGLVLLSTRSDLQVAGHDREAATAFYAAEAGVAVAKEWLLPRATGTGAGAWNAVLTSAAPQLCTGGNGSSPGTQPAVTNPAVNYDAARNATYQFCVHNNVLDSNYFATPPSGDVADADAVITVESYGTGANGARTHLTVDLKIAGAAGSGVQEYFQAGGDSRKMATGEAGQVASGSRTF